jgi:hypothetical protein
MSGQKGTPSDYSVDIMGDAVVRAATEAEPRQEEHEP